LICTVITPAIGQFQSGLLCDKAHNGLLDTRRLANGGRLAAQLCVCLECDWCDY